MLLRAPDMKSIAVSLGVLVAVTAWACTVGPNYSRPIVQVPDTYRSTSVDVAPSSAAPSLGDQTWWDVFDDPVLQDLIRTAVRQNFDVRIAAARMLQAQAQLGIVRADQAPAVDGGAGAVRERLPKVTVLQAFAPVRIG